MGDFFQDAGFFVYPLLACSLVAAVVVVERFYYLLTVRICPPDLLQAIGRGEIPKDPGPSMLGRLVKVVRAHPGEEEAVQALARLEVNGLQRGLVVLEVVIAIAPLLGLLGTVTGLIKVFASITPETGMPDPGMFVEGVALALVTTGMGLAIAIPGLVFHGYFQRKAETFAVELDSALSLVKVAEKKTS